jgi:hypothetical protein
MDWLYLNRYTEKDTLLRPKKTEIGWGDWQDVWDVRGWPDLSITIDD